jgi:hypothetical protein
MVDCVIEQLLANYFLTIDEIRDLTDPGQIPWEMPNAMLALAVIQATTETLNQFVGVGKRSLEGVRHAKGSLGVSNN